MRSAALARRVARLLLVAKGARHLALRASHLLQAPQLQHARVQLSLWCRRWGLAGLPHAGEHPSPVDIFLLLRLLCFAHTNS